MSDAINSEARLVRIMEEIRELKDKHHKQAKATGENFNVFSFLSIEEKEKTHSDIIAELLNPHGSHNQEELFLKIFLKQLKLTIDVSNEHTGFKVRTEKFFSNPVTKEEGRPDIVIESVDAYIVIENKIETGDHEEQLKKYYNHIKDEKIDKTIKRLYYLTLNGDKPNNYSHPPESEIGFYQLSYCEDIIKWLEACIKEVDRIPQIKEILRQYQMTVKKLTGHPINRRYVMALKDILLKDKNYNLIPELETAISEVKNAFQHEFWKELKERLVKEQLADKKLRFRLYESGLKDEEISDDRLEEYVGYNFLGLTFSIPIYLLGSEDHEVAFRVDYQTNKKHYSFNYGFVFCKKDTLQRDQIGQHRNDLGRYMRLKHPSASDKDKPSHGNDGWLSWNYFEYEHTSFIAEIKEALIEDLISEINSALLEARENK